ncbi:MAG TPA: hypothetical protein VGG92_04515, partial [Caulobacteraceae bacterium]
SFVVYREDRIRSVRGESLLTKLKLRDNSPTNRKIATCCNSVMVLDFDDGKHWADIYSARVNGNAPRPEALVCTKFAPESPNNPDHIQVSSGYSGRIMFKILKARAEMLFSK